MLIDKPASFIQTFVEDLNDGLKELEPTAKLTRIQRTWLGFCLMGILLVNSVCWAKFERASLGGYKIAALSWMLRQSKIAWSLLLLTSVKLVLKQYRITEGVLVIDESDRTRCKRTCRIHKAHKLKDKMTGGYVNGQTIVLLLLVTDTVTLPVGFNFYMPDPVLSAWEKENKRLLKKGVVKKDRPAKPQLNPEYPTKQQLGLRLLQEFKENHSEISIKTILVDALYGNSKFMDKASNIFLNVQVISQLHKNQNISYKGKTKNLEKYFNSINKGYALGICVRGDKKITAIVSSARLKVNAHGKKRFVIALKYEGEENYRYLVATNMSWQAKDIIQAYSLRWLVEVFFEDWKLYEGWAREAKQYDEEGSSRGLLLSLLLDHCLILHPEQMVCIENKLPAYTVGSLQRKLQMEALLEFIKSLLQYENPGEQLKELGTIIKEVFQLIPSKKHLIGRDLGRLEPTPSLKYRFAG